MEAQKNEVHNSDSFLTRPTCENRPSMWSINVELHVLRICRLLLIVNIRSYTTGSLVEQELLTMSA